MKKVQTALTIAGTDPTGGAGIQADLKSFEERCVYGMSVVTSVVAQNTQGVSLIHHQPIDMINEQLACVFDDIQPDAIKTGMIATEEMMLLISDYLEQYPDIPYVLDPVMVATSGDVLMEESSRAVIRDVLIPKATLVTPNLKEARLLLDRSITTVEEMAEAAKDLVHVLGASAAVVKGGHLTDEATDVFYDGKDTRYLTKERIKTKHTHGTGCTYSAVITAELAKGQGVFNAASLGKAFIHDAIFYGIDLGHGNGPTNHFGYRLKGVPNDIKICEKIREGERS
ncbi:hydroxymethylpyrimidine/phosphomethylpyrimidine kinase [Halolactibacillus halophilus]|uniref:Hydroxymethylpyrimidine/phosphomethylpyrimidine kinase n=1 Tax=Halolactibacillus halophilus TaxID=306540 RepID=A0A1I5QKM6_9BACI|nr:bifunctional hydroxymethylpyrimidine kinase/phosphomethylpyrimidine kinase [Halolactibacillus halophilus]GEM01836.1 hydroxymethylpyrimidine/phosphomethylpyrimidine kinase [Halolactibacillus halophilus]SFP46591.1 hydroxymethylpyrimidine/phosphomethylpyrimidine kinase [Halolactibacillus halophilus]